MGLIVEPPRARSRAAGGLLGIAGGEAWQGHGGFDHDGPVTAAMVDLCHSYIRHRGKGDTPEQVARRHTGVPGPGWLLPAAVAVHGTCLRNEVVTLAEAADAPPDVLSAYVRYAQLASDLFAAIPVHIAIEAATGKPAAAAIDDATLQASRSGPSRPKLCGIAAVDALTVGIWALGQPHHHLADVAPWIGRACEPWVAAAAVGLLGLRDGCAGIPAEWHRCLRVTATCLDLAPRLTRTAHPGMPAGTGGGEPHLVIAS